MKTRKYYPGEYIPLLGVFFRRARFDQLNENYLKELMQKQMPCFKRARLHKRFYENVRQELFTFGYRSYHVISAVPILSTFMLLGKR